MATNQYIFYLMKNKFLSMFYNSIIIMEGLIIIHTQNYIKVFTAH